MTESPLAIDLFSGLGGWAEGAEAAGFDVIRVDIKDMFEAVGMPKPTNCLLMLQDVRTIHGSQFKHADLLLSSSPCQEFSYRAMPWKRAKALHAPFLGIYLFWEQFRIQREASEAKGRLIPMVVENVRGAQEWVGKARWNAGSMYFWGDVPALMPVHKHVKVSNFQIDWSGRSLQSANLAEPTKSRTALGGGARFTSIERAERANGKPTSLAWGNESRWFNDGPRSPDSISSSSSSSLARKRASALIAKIPFDISYWIARTYRENSR